jgi:putative addiction module component (TIGR02574 family)
MLRGMRARISLADVLSLSIPERIQLVQDIWDSIAEVPDSIELTDAQREELDRRVEAHKRDPEAASSWEVVRERLLKRI